MAANSTEAHLVRGILDQYSIETIFYGEALSIGAGGLPCEVVQVQILVNEKKYSEALSLISNYEKTLSDPSKDGANWNCQECNNVNPETFEICWNCQANCLTGA